jgi:SAM-dependent methyltransferase
MSAFDLERSVSDWTRTNRSYEDARAAELWAQDEITWGVFGVSESQVGALGDVSGLDVLDLGCGIAYFSAWLARRGARVVGVDPTPAQLATARRLQAETGLEFPLVEASGESVPLRDASFDLVLSESGASTYAAPEQWLAEAARLLRPGGRLVFLVSSPLSMLCADEAGVVGDRPLRAQFGMYRFDWAGEDSFEYALAHGEWIRLLLASGFDVEALHELRAPDGAVDYFDLVAAGWARQWPAEDLWVGRKRG